MLGGVGVEPPVSPPLVLPPVLLPPVLGGVGVEPPEPLVPLVPPPDALPASLGVDGVVVPVDGLGFGVVVSAIAPFLHGFPPKTNVGHQIEPGGLRCVATREANASQGCYGLVS